jgi:hypothetical protein
MICVVLMAISLTVGRSTVAEASDFAPSAESTQTGSAAAFDGLATMDSAFQRLLPAGLRAIAVGSAAIVLSGTGPALAGRAQSSRGASAVLADVGDRWRALLTGAPPARFSF